MWRLLGVLYLLAGVLSQDAPETAADTVDTAETGENSTYCETRDDSKYIPLVLYI